MWKNIFWASYQCLEMDFDWIMRLSLFILNFHCDQQYEKKKNVVDLRDARNSSHPKIYCTKNWVINIGSVNYSPLLLSHVVVELNLFSWMNLFHKMTKDVTVNISQVFESLNHAPNVFRWFNRKVTICCLFRILRVSISHSQESHSTLHDTWA